MAGSKWPARQQRGWQLPPERSLATCHQCINDGRIGECRRIAEPSGCAFGDLAEDPPHDLAGSGFWKCRREMDLLRRRKRTNVAANLCIEFLAELVASFLTRVQSDECVDRLSLDVVRVGDHGRLRDLGMRNQGAFDFGCPDAVPGDIDYIVNAPRYPIIAILVSPAAVASKVKARVGLEVGVEETAMIVPDRAHLPRPGGLDAKIAARWPVEHVMLGIDEKWFYPRKRLGRASRLHFGCTGERRNENAARLRLPPGVHHGAATLADNPPVPFPRLGIDRLADGSKQADRGAVMALHGLVAFAHQRTNCGRRRVEDRDTEAMRRFPETAGVGVIRYTVEHHARRAHRKRAIDDVAVPGDPADIGGAPEDIVATIVEDPLERGCDPDAIATGCVDDALGLAR